MAPARLRSHGFIRRCAVARLALRWKRTEDRHGRGKAEQGHGTGRDRTGQALVAGFACEFLDNVAVLQGSNFSRSIRVLGL